MHPWKLVSAGLMVAALAVGNAAAAPRVTRTEVIGPFTGVEAELHPDNVSPHRIRYYGTDLGWTYEHKGTLHIIFGDTNAAEDVSYIEESSGDKFDDGFGTIDLDKWRHPSKITPDNLPMIKLGQIPGSAEMAAIHPGDHAMEGFKTPVGAFSNGSRQYGVFYTSKQQGCVTDADCSSGLTCDTGLGYVGKRYNDDEGHTYACIDGSRGCNPNPVNDADGNPLENSGLCIDRTSSNWAQTDMGRVSAVGLKHMIGIRSKDDPRIYTHNKVWLTTKFANPALRTVERFLPAAATERETQDYRPATGHDGSERVFLWGRPGFMGVGATGRSLGLYFAYVDMPKGANFTWRPHYYAGMDDAGNPRFSPDEKEAAAVDLDSTRPGVQAQERHDIVNQMSVAWVPTLEKWVMFYGGGVSTLRREGLPNCGLLEFFTGSECKRVDVGNGAVRMRTADHPWGPWTPPRDVIVGGDPRADPLEYQYVEGGVLRHPDCRGENCAPHTGGNLPQDYGFFYAANIIAEWIEPSGNGVNIIWNASTWDPYRIVLLRTHITP